MLRSSLTIFSALSPLSSELCDDIVVYDMQVGLRKKRNSAEVAYVFGECVEWETINFCHQLSDPKLRKGKFINI